MTDNFNEGPNAHGKAQIQGKNEDPKVDCIHRKLFGNKGQADTKIKIHTYHSYRTVSYTHLDVYKRQHTHSL